MGRKKKLLPVDTPRADVLKALRNRMSKDVEIMERTPLAAADKKLYPVDNLKDGVEWLTWLENEKRNEERRLSKTTEGTNNETTQ